MPIAPKSITYKRAVQRWTQATLYGVMGVILCSLGLAWAEPYDISVKQPALWEADHAVFYEGSMYLIGWSEGGVEDSNQAIMLDNAFIAIAFWGRLHASGTLECAVPPEIPTEFRSGVTFALYRSRAGDALLATIIIGSRGGDPEIRATGWVVRCLNSQSCNLGVEHVAEVDLGPVQALDWHLWVLWWDAASHMVYFARDLYEPDQQIGAAFVPDPFKFPLTKKYFEARATSAACPESLSVGMLEVGGIEIFR